VIQDSDVTYGADGEQDPWRIGAPLVLRRMLIRVVLAMTWDVSQARELGGAVLRCCVLRCVLW